MSWDLGWADFDFCVPPSCRAAQPLLPNSHQPKQNQANSGKLQIQVNKTQSQLTWDTLCIICYSPAVVVDTKVELSIALALAGLVSLPALA